MNNTLVSVIIPCYNDKLYVRNAVESIIAQDYNEIQIVVVDDGSDVETKKVLSGLKPNIDILIEQENQGQSAARNHAIDRAEGEIILTLDSDDYFESSFIGKAVKIFSDTSCRLVTSYSNIIINEERTRVYKPLGGVLKDFLFSNGCHGSCMFRKKNWASVGGYDETMRKGWEDWEFNIRLLSTGGYCQVIPEVLFNYRFRKDSTSSRANKVKYHLWEYILKKHRTLYVGEYDTMIDFFLEKLEQEEKEKIKNRERIEFKLGELFTGPIRFIKSKL